MTGPERAKRLIEKEYGKPRVFYLHFNRIAMQRKDPKVWSVRTSKGCFHADSVIVDTTLTTVYKPLQRNNPRAFFKGFGYGMWVTDKLNKEHLVLTDQPWDMNRSVYVSELILNLRKPLKKPRKQARK